MNTIKIDIGGVDYSKYVVSPVKLGNLLDERLDEVNITLRYIDKPYFEPQTLVRVNITNAPEAAYSSEMARNILNVSDYGFTERLTDKYQSSDWHMEAVYENGTFTQLYVKYFIVASDNSIETIPGSGRFEHEIYLIERTKFLEGFIGDSITFTNPNAKTYGGFQYAPFKANANIGAGELGEKIYNSTFYKNPREQLILQGVQDLFQNVCDAYSDYPGIRINFEPAQRIDTGLVADITKKPMLQQVVVYKNDVEMYSQKITFSASSDYPSGYKLTRRTVLNGEVTVEEYDAVPSSGNYTILNIEQTTIPATTGNYTVEYRWILAWKDYTTIYDTSTNYMDVSELVLSIYKGKSAPKKWTISDVVDRICDTLEPNRTENRFSFDSTQKLKYDQVIAPEFSFTKMTLREMLRTVGGFIHAEPRLKDDTSQNVIMFDEYGSKEQSNISSKNYIGYKLKSDINEWCTSLDSSADNLVNQLDFAQGVAYEPARGSMASITLRTETVSARLLQDNSTFIPTSLPIYKIQKLIVLNVNGNAVNYDITPYVYEQADYDGLLQSNGGAYPLAKACAVYYAQGSKNIKGLFYKEESAISPYLKDFSIVNIIRAASGDSTIDISGTNLYYIGFQIQYTPIYSARIRTIKPTLTSGREPRTIAYNQGENLIETRYYGENLKGVVARLGNIEKTYTYHLAYLSDIPKVGYLFDKHYYISAVYVEILQSVIKCTIGLSKDFNRFSQYVGISSNKRMWEVSEKQSQERQSIYTEYLKVSMTDTAGNDPNICFSPIEFMVFDSRIKNSSITLARIKTKTKSKEQIADITLPVISSAFGNSLVFTFSFEDNYSAGEQTQEYGTDGNKVVWGQYVPYGDYFGRFYYMDIDFSSSVLVNWDGKTIPETPNKARYEETSIKITDLKYRKDNREIPQISYELAAYSDDEDIIVGSALMRNCHLVNSSPIPLVAYGFKSRLNKINSELNLSEGISLGIIRSTSDTPELNSGIHFTIPLNDSVKDCESFAIVTKQTDTVINVSDDDGNETTQTIKTGGTLYIGVNKSYDEIKDNPKIYLSVRKSI